MDEMRNNPPFHKAILYIKPDELGPHNLIFLPRNSPTPANARNSLDALALFKMHQIPMPYKPIHQPLLLDLSQRTISSIWFQGVSDHVIDWKGDRTIPSNRQTGDGR
jgi:hypothetical protein